MACHTKMVSLEYTKHGFAIEIYNLVPLTPPVCTHQYCPLTCESVKVTILKAWDEVHEHSQLLWGGCC